MATPQSPNANPRSSEALGSWTVNGRSINHGPTPTNEASENGIKQQKVYVNYHVTKVVGDGRCLFRAVAHGMRLRFMKFPNKIEHRMADILRTEAVDELVRRRETSEWFIEGNFDAYVRHMRLPHTFGGEPELLMLSRVLRHPITVYMERKKKEGGGIIVVAEYGQEEHGTNGNSKKSPISLLYHSYGHYEALQVSPENATLHHETAHKH